MSELTLFSQAFSEELHIIQLDNASAPTATDLDIPNNFILFYQPPYCPKVNPNERVWLYFLRTFWVESMDTFSELAFSLIRLKPQKNPYFSKGLTAAL
ncbi:transposase [Microcystis aeruginosa FACHB-905 = DIANCHI905]|nr:transposase [Microcystis aeruginosa FACHB-905 = DIANCHI905]